MPQNIFEIFALLLFTTLVIFRGFKISISKIDLEYLIKDKLESDVAKVKSINKLTFRERIKYGVAPIDLLRIYNYYFGIFSGKLEYSRKVILEKETNNSETKYVSVTTKNRKLYHFNEFDSYDL